MLVNVNVTLATNWNTIRISLFVSLLRRNFSHLMYQKNTIVLQICTKNELCSDLLFLSPFCLYVAFTRGHSQRFQFILPLGRVSSYGCFALYLSIHTNLEYFFPRACLSFLLWYQQHTTIPELIFFPPTMLNTF